MDLPIDREARSCSPRKCRGFARKFPFQHSEFVNRALLMPFHIQDPCQYFGNAQKLEKSQFSEGMALKNTCQLVGFATNSRSDFDREESWNARISSSGKAMPFSTRSSGRAVPRPSTGRYW